MTRHLLTINAGSSSLKLAAFDLDGSHGRSLDMRVERIGSEEARLHVADGQGTTLLDERRSLRDHVSAIHACVDWLRRNHLKPVEAVGHRVVHGGARHRQPEKITAALVSELRAVVPIDPDHMPQAIAGIEAIGGLYPSALQVACFDTAFHRTMPRVAQMYALPESLFAAGVVRYGFHGLSCESILASLGRISPEEAQGRLIVAHLGNGASMTAIAGGASVETTMGFSPTGGLAMGTRSGDIDPSALVYLMESRKLSADRLRRMINRESGLLGVSGVSADMRDLLELEPSDARAADAIALFCYTARKFLGALVAVLGGLDTLVFTGGIGEHASPVRERICTRLACFGIELDPGRNTRHEAVISRQGGHVTVRVMRTDEESTIAKHVRKLLSSEGVEDVSI